MANEYLRRTPTSTGNRRVWTASLWYKMSSAGAFFGAGDGSTAGNSSHWWFNSDQLGYSNNDGTNYVTVLRKSRDFSSWSHYMLVVDTTKVEPYDRVVFYENGVRNEVDTTSGYTNPSRNAELSWINQLWSHHIGARNRAGANTFSTGEYCDFFFVDGQALTPDVFGFYKQGKGYISVGSTQATDFRPGQWVPKTPRVIKTEINRRGGFGVNGFYLPMNDSNNFGADFHGEPNSIITLNEKLPQPRVGVVTTASVGLGYTDALRADPYAANLVLALPFVSGGLSSGFGDYAPSIKGSGTAKSITVTGTVSIASTASYYGSAALFNATSVTENNLLTVNNAVCDFGTGDFTVEFWGYPFVVDTGNNNYVIETLGLGGTRFAVLRQGDGAQSGQYTLVMGNNAYDITSTNYGINQWHHLAVCRKNGLVTAYLNGVATYTNTITTDITAQSGAYIGAVPNSSVIYEYQGYLQDLRIYKGVAKYTGGFDVPRPYTPVGIATWRAIPDTTANNFASMNPLYPVISGSNSTYTNGNLTVSDATSNGSQVSATIGVSTGKWYYEALAGNVSGGSHLIGIRPAEWFTFNPQNRTSYRSDGFVYNDAGGTAQSGTSYSSSDIIGVAIDMNTRKLWFSKNGSFVYSGNPSAGTNEAVSFASTYTHYAPAAMFDNVAGTQTWDTNFGQNPTFSGNTTAGTFTDSNGKGLFKYQPPTGFLALCEDNLPTPAISNPGQYFKTVLWTGSGSARSIVGVGFTTDFVWIKSRTNGGYFHNLVDSVRGPSRRLASNVTGAEDDASAGGATPILGSFDYDGFSLPNGNVNVNESGGSYVAWCWRAGAGTTSTNTNGTINSVVSVNQDAGFSIVSYTGNGNASATVGHGLGRTPAMVIVKCRNEVRSWIVFHRGASPTPNPLSSTTFALGSLSSGCLSLNLTNGTFAYTMDGQTNLNGNTYIAYCWVEIEGFSKFGSYVGNGSADGPFVYCGFKPAFVMIKRTDGGSENWIMFDNVRKSVNDGDQRALFANIVDAEGTGWPIDFVSNGFKNRYVGSTNVNGATYIFIAFAESPFTTANAK